MILVVEGVWVIIFYCVVSTRLRRVDLLPYVYIFVMVAWQLVWHGARRYQYQRLEL